MMPKYLTILLMLISEKNVIEAVLTQLDRTKGIIIYISKAFFVITAVIFSVLLLMSLLVTAP